MLSRLCLAAAPPDAAMPLSLCNMPGSFDMRSIAIFLKNALLSGLMGCFGFFACPKDMFFLCISVRLFPVIEIERFLFAPSEKAAARRRFTCSGLGFFQYSAVLLAAFSLASGVCITFAPSIALLIKSGSARRAESDFDILFLTSLEVIRPFCLSEFAFLFSGVFWMAILFLSASGVCIGPAPFKGR